MAFVQKGTLVNQSSGSTSMTSSITGVTAGNLLVAAVNWGTTSTTDTAPSATGWSIAKTSLVSTSHVYSQYTTIYYKENVASGSHSLSLSFSAGDTQGNSIIAEFSGYATSSSLDTAACNTANFGVGSDVTSGSISTAAVTAQANELVIVIFAWDDANGVSNIGLLNPSGYSNLFLVTNSSSFNPAVSAYKEVTSTGTQTVSQTGLTSGWGSATIVAFKAASGASNTLTGLNSTQAEQSSAAAATQAQQTFGANASQADNSSSTASTQAQQISGSNVTQVALSSVGSTMPSVTVAGASSTQASISATGLLVQVPNLQAGSSSQAAISSASASSQVQHSAGTNVTQAAVSSVGSVTSGSSSASVVSVTNIKQVWQSGTDWTAHTVTVPQAGDAILTFMLAYLAGTLGQKYPPTDNNGTFIQGVDLGRPDPGSYPSYPQPLLSTIYYELNAATGSHTITPPNIGPAVNDDGNLWVVVVSGLQTSGSPTATGNFHAVSSSAGTTYPNVSVSLSGNCQIGDIVFAILGYDNDRSFGGPVTFTDPSGWTKIASETDAVTNCPSEVFWKIATASDTETVTLSWNDAHATVVDASIIAFPPTQSPVTLTGSNAAQATGSTASTISSVVQTTGTNVSQAELSSTSGVTAVQSLAATSSAQAGLSATGVILFGVSLGGQSVSGVSLSSANGVTLAYTLAAQGVTATSGESVSQVASSNSLAGSTSIVVSIAGTGVVFAGTVIQLTAQSVSVIASSSSASLSQVVVIAASQSIGASSSGVANMTQTYAPTALNAAQSNVVLMGFISLGVVVPININKISFYISTTRHRVKLVQR